MRIIHVGLGGRGRKWFTAIREHGKAKCVAAVDPDPTNQSWAKRSLGQIPLYNSLEDVVQVNSANAVVISGPPQSHAKIAEKALKMGLAVVVEPPAGMGVAEAKSVYGVAASTSRPLIIAHHRRLEPGAVALRKMIEAGRVGRVTQVSVLSRRSFSPEVAVQESEYTELIGNGIQEFDSIASVLGLKPVSVIARSITAPWSTNAHGSTTEAFLEMEGDVHVHYHGSLTAGTDERETWIEGQSGTLWSDGGRVWWRKRGWPRFVPFPKRRGVSGRVRILQELEAALASGKGGHAHGAEELQTLAAVEAAVRSDQSRRPVTVAEVLKEAKLDA